MRNGCAAPGRPERVTGRCDQPAGFRYGCPRDVCAKNPAGCPWSYGISHRRTGRRRRIPRTAATQPAPVDAPGGSEGSKTPAARVLLLRRVPLPFLKSKPQALNRDLRRIRIGTRPCPVFRHPAGEETVGIQELPVLPADLEGEGPLVFREGSAGGVMAVPCSHSSLRDERVSFAAMGTGWQPVGGGGLRGIPPR